MDTPAPVTRRTVLVAGVVGAGGVVTGGLLGRWLEELDVRGRRDIAAREFGSDAGQVDRHHRRPGRVGQAADGSPAIVARPTATTAVAFSAICTHEGCTVNPAGSELDCPCPAPGTTRQPAR